VLIGPQRSRDRHGTILAHTVALQAQTGQIALAGQQPVQFGHGAGVVKDAADEFDRGLRQAAKVSGSRKAYSASSTF